MYLGRKEFETFKSETLSYLNAVEKNQEGMLEILETIVSEQNNFQKSLSTLEENLDRLETFIADNDNANSRRISEILLTLTKETDKIRKSHNTGMKQIREAMNTLMLEHLLDRAEMLCKASEKAVKATSSSKTKSNFSKSCPLCGAMVLNDDSVCLYCGHKF